MDKTPANFEILFLKRVLIDENIKIWDLHKAGKPNKK